MLKHSCIAHDNCNCLEPAEENFVIGDEHNNERLLSHNYEFDKATSPTFKILINYNKMAEMCPMDAMFTENYRYRKAKKLNDKVLLASKG